LTGFLGELMKLPSLCEEVTVGRFDVDAQMVSRLGWFPKSRGRIAEQSEPEEEVIDSLVRG
jgi:hypothetical protein